jgi:hypothetical protein
MTYLIYNIVIDCQEKNEHEKAFDPMRVQEVIWKEEEGVGRMPMEKR